MSIIYLATLKNLISENDFKERKYNYLVIKEHNYKLRKILRNQKQISVDLVKNYDLSNKYLLSFKVEETQGIGFKAYVNSKFEEFKKENNNINRESISDFFKFLEADGLYDFEAFSLNEELNEPSAPIKLPELLNEEVYPSSQNFAEAEQFSPRSRSNSLSEKKIETESLMRVNSSPELLVENSNLKSIECSTSSLESIENESSKIYNNQLAQEIQSVFSKENPTLLNINKHGSVIQKGFFNGQEKSTCLRLISKVAGKIDHDSRDLLNNSSSEVDIETLKHTIYELEDFINDKQNRDVLSRYRGFSPLRCFATLWGGGKVKSIEYVEQLQEQLNTLTKNISDIRPTV